MTIRCRGHLQKRKKDSELRAFHELRPGTWAAASGPGRPWSSAWRRCAEGAGVQSWFRVYRIFRVFRVFGVLGSRV